MAKFSRSLTALAVLLVAGGAAYLTRDKWQSYAPQWLNAYLPPADGAPAAGGAPGQQGNAQGGSGGARQRGGRRGSFDAGPIPVLTADAKTADVPVTMDGVGTVKALNTVTITPQVGGQLIDLPFREGQDVKKGDVIARIDDSTYRATLDQAIAKRAQDQALLDNAKLDLQRYIGLVANNSVTKQTADTQRATVAQNEAQVKSDDAAIASAKATLAYTTITAPIDGRTGIRNVDVGNVVQASSTTGIVTITQVQPIAVVFNLPQQALQQISKAAGAGQLPVSALGGNGHKVIDTGQLDVIDNQVDSTTGTIRLKAIFPNEAEKLWPGAFVNARLLLRTLKDVIVIPTAAVQRGPNGTFVYVMSDEGKAQMRPVTIQQQDDQQAVVATGLKVGEHVITTGFARLSDGASVQIAAPGAAVPGGAGAGVDAGVGGTTSDTAPQTAPAANPPANGADRKGGHKGHRRNDADAPSDGAAPANPPPAP
ncbi:efflux RND transporter periplasmic adaptor subunit [Labrys monachus]|uniref:Multidrug efflux system membrane fusion protein n=1 Tax=Labrys monachus TaxID=217067 RepID=A0ABU0FGA1_9HYPH|nr:efflux RND transporter periplasmic adaptor subunit [Labrys monachus]MDQ0393138.1 multidrug efflux system membrane fusion protein [Labrys monachus]